MINITDNKLVFLMTGHDLHHEIRDSIICVAKALLKMLDLEKFNLSSVSTKTYSAASYPKFMLGHTLQQKSFFDESYVENIWHFYQGSPEDMGPERFYAITLSSPDTSYAYRATYAKAFKRGLGLLLLSLHSRGVITLPMHFNWPMGLAKMGKWSQDPKLFCELISFIRSLDSPLEELPHPAFQSVGMSQKRKEWFLCYGMKLLLATGWLSPKDAKLEDLIAIKNAESSIGFGDKPSSFKALIDVLRERYGADFPISVEDWTNEIRITSTLLKRTKGNNKFRLEKVVVDAAIKDSDLLSEVFQTPPSMALTDVLRGRPRLPGLDVELKTLSSKWLDLQDVYTRAAKRESYQGTKSAIGYLNIYLFFYLPFWMQRRPDSRLKFPDEPHTLRPSIFVSRLIEPSDEEDLPLTFVEFLEAYSKYREWAAMSHYAVLKQVERFFAFLELNRDDLPGCKGFRQPIPDYAYPPTARSKGTNKRPIPRRIFGIFLDYVEALKVHLQVVLEKTLNGDLDSAKFNRDSYRTSRYIIDTFATSSQVGFIPIIFVKGRTIPLQFIPNCLQMDWFTVVDGVSLKLPQPHALNQILVALYTGLRHNHIQWLDERNFDKGVNHDAREFTVLNVNTDKSMRSAWTSHVNFRVIEVLRDQRNWRNLIKMPGFEKLCYYNNNPNTKWPPILPLFSSGMQGQPHADARYERVWRRILCAVSALLPSLGETGLQSLIALDPPGVLLNDPSADAKRWEYGSKCRFMCELSVKTDITPHSTRVSVVSQYSSLLPAEIIGSHITGQKTGTVYHYVVLDDEDLNRDKTVQAMQLRGHSIRDSDAAWGKAYPTENQFVRADDVNSNLSKSLRKDLQETLVSYGCISITMNEGETSGLDVLRETRAASAAENKTEICPYGNQCPPEIIKQWRGGHRCGLCQYAVRSVDHLPAVSAKVKQFSEMLDDLTEKLDQALNSDTSLYTDDEFDRLDEERSRLAEELTGWRLNEEVLDTARVRIARGQDHRKWLVQKPEIILKDLQRVKVPSNLTAYLITRLGECITYPTCESSQIRARFDIMRRNLLARKGLMRRAFDLAVPVNPAAECAGLLRTLVESNSLCYEDIVNLLEGADHLDDLTSTPNQLLLEGEST